MKTIKSALIGAKQIAASDEHQIKHELRDILSKHRDVVITHLLKDVYTYVQYKTSTKPSPKAIAEIKERLVSLKNAPLDLNKYTSICNAVLNRALIHIDNHYFYAEIDQIITSAIGTSMQEIETARAAIKNAEAG